MCIINNFCIINNTDFVTLYNIPYCKILSSVLLYSQKGWYQCTGKNLQGSTKIARSKIDVHFRIQKSISKDPGSWKSKPKEQGTNSKPIKSDDRAKDRHQNNRKERRNGRKLWKIWLETIASPRKNRRKKVNRRKNLSCESKNATIQKGAKSDKAFPSETFRHSGFSQTRV